jgi:hypothetical protein
VKAFIGVDASAWRRVREKSILIEPKPHPPFEPSHWMMVSEELLFGSLSTAVFQALGA